MARFRGASTPISFLRELAAFRGDTATGADPALRLSRPPAHVGRHASRPMGWSVPLPVSWTREGDITIAPPPSIVDPDVTKRSRLIGQAAIAASRAATGV
jgi:hypothetical protein